MHRRKILGLSSAALALLLSGCAQTNPVTGQPQPPTVDDVKNWLQTVSQELPAFISELAATGTLKGSLTDVNGYLQKFQLLVTSFMQMPPGVDPSTILNDVVQVAVTIMGFIPAAAPFAPLLIGLQLLIGAFLKRQPVVSPSGTPIPVPKPPVPAALARMHAETRSLRR